MAADNDTIFVLKAVDEVTATLERIQSRLAGLRGSVEKTDSTIKKSSLSQFGEKMSGIGKSLSSFGSRMTASVSLPIFFMGKSAVETASNFETLDIALTTMLGNADKAKQLREELVKFATKTPFQVSDIGQTAQQLLAVGISQEKLIPTLKTLGDVAAGLNIPLERIVMNYGQVRTQNKLTGREMKDFLVAGIPLIDELAKSRNVKKSAIPDMISAGKISFKEVEKAFQNMTNEGGKFNNLMNKISTGTFKGKLSNLQDQLSLLGAQFGEAITPDIEKFAETISKLADKFSNLSPETKTLIARIALFVAVLGPVLFYIGMLAQGIGGLAIVGSWISSAFAALASLATLIGGLSLATFGWIAAIAAAVAAVVAGGVWVYRNWDKVKTLLTKLWDGPLFSVLKWLNPIYLVYRLGKLIYDRWESIKQFFIKIWDSPIGSALKFLTPIGQIIAAVKLIKDNWGTISEFFSGLWDGIAQGFEAMINQITSKIKAFGTIVDYALFGKSGELFSSATITNPDGSVAQNDLGNAMGTFMGQPWQTNMALPKNDVQTNNSKVTIDFKNMPDGVGVKSDGSDNLDLNLGLVGVL